MAIDDSNQAQADFWATAGTMWTALRDRFDDQAGVHGLAAIDALDPQPGERIIDIGCGAGSSTMQIAERVGSDGLVTGFDISPTMIDGARELATSRGVANVEFGVGDAMVEPFAAVHDGVYSRFGVMFFSDAVRGFANMRTALRPGGRLGFVCWQTPDRNGWASRPLSVAARFADMPFGNDPTAPGPFSLGNRDRLEAVLADAGYADVRIEGREAQLKTGTDLDDAAEFVFNLMPPAAALRESDPVAAAELKAVLIEELSDWDTGDGVLAPSAVWIVTAVNSG